jgi:8-oxo-dGTP pyrophosphatase MutT (NUDIX family)
MKKCGIILFNEEEQKYFLVFGRKSSKWGFPKGHMEKGETEKETALREFYEETGFELKNRDLKNRFQIKNNIYFQTSISNPNELVQKNTDIPDSNEILKTDWLSLIDIIALDIQNCNFGLKLWRKKKMNSYNDSNYRISYQSVHIKDSTYQVNGMDEKEKYLNSVKVSEK